MDYKIVTVCLLLWCVCVMDCYPTGAPVHACTNLLPHHDGTIPQNSPSPYTIKVSSNTYTPQTPLIVSVFGTPEYLAFIVQGQRRDSNEPAGQFVKIPINTKYLRCTNDQDTVTHANVTPRNITQFIWDPPLIDVGEIIFKGTVAQSRSKYYGVLQSSPITFSHVASGSNGAISPLPGDGFGHRNGVGKSYIIGGYLTLILSLMAILWL